MAGLSLWQWPAPQASAQAGAPPEPGGGLEVVGEMSGPPDPTPGDNTPEYRPCSPRKITEAKGGCAFLVDPELNIAFGKTSGQTIFGADLARLNMSVPFPQSGTGIGALARDHRNYAIDTVRDRLYRIASRAQTDSYVPPVALFTSSSTCAPGRARTRDFDIVVWDYAPSPGGAVASPRTTVMPCADTGGPVVEPFVAPAGGGFDVDEPSGAVYMSGFWGLEDHWRCPLGACGSSTLFQVEQGLHEGSGQSLLARQARLDEQTDQWIVDWDVDLRIAGCGRRKADVTDSTPWLGRLGNTLLAYCWGQNATLVSPSPQGFVVRIPLSVGQDGIARPVPRTGGALVRDARGAIVNYAYSRIPTLPGSVTIILDKVSARLILATDGAVNGNAFWVFDVHAGRFVGVVAGGNAQQPAFNTAVGFDRVRGIAYLLTKDGILRGDIRTTPPSPGILYPVVTNPSNAVGFATDSIIGVAPGLRRLFVPVAGPDPAAGSPRRWYVIVEDRVADAPVPIVPSPDSLTTDLDEVPGKTESRAAGAAMASAIHVVGAGGLARAIGGVDPACEVEVDTDGNGAPENRVNAEAGVVGANHCVSEEVFTPGHREAFVAASQLEVASGSGALGSASGLAWGAGDSATDADLRRVGECAADLRDRPERYGRASPRHWGTDPSGPFFDDPDRSGDEQPGFDNGWQELQRGRDQFWGGLQPLREGVYGSPAEPGPYAQACNGAHDGATAVGLPDTRAGKFGPDGRGVPVSAARCGDFGGAPSVDGRPPSDDPQAALTTSSARCDLGANTAAASSSVTAAAVPTPGEPQLSIGRTASNVASTQTAEGQVTLAYAEATGVQIGPLRIGEIQSLAVTKARGRPGTTSAVLVRRWCRLSVEGAPDEVKGCIDPDAPSTEALLEDLNEVVLQQRVRLTVPESSLQATPRGYQAVVTKSAIERGGDQTVNDDDSFTVAALQAVFYNDGNQGRNRIIVQLAGVHAESRYGIVELPNFSGGIEPGPELGPHESTEEVTAPVSAPAGESLPATPPVPTEQASFEETVFESVPEVERRLPASPAPQVQPRERGSLPERVIRVPVGFVSDAIRLLVQHPREFALLFVMWALLAAPVYLGSRRRAFARAVAS